MTAGKQTHTTGKWWKILCWGLFGVGYIENNSNCYTYVVRVYLFNDNNIYVARCRRLTGSKYGGQESGSTHVAMVFLHTYVANGGGKVSFAKTAEPMEMPFEFWAWMGPRNHVLDGGPDPPRGRAILRGKGMPRHARRHSDVACAKKAEPVDMPIELRTRVGTRKHVLDGV